MPATTLTDSDRSAIVDAFEAGATRVSLAETYGVHPNTITRTLRGADRPIRKAKPRSLNEAETLTLVDAYVSGEATMTIATRFGVTVQHVSATALAHGAAPRRPGHPGRPPVLSEQDVEAVVRAYEQGASLRELAGRLHVSTGAIVHALERRGVARRRGHYTGQSDGAGRSALDIGAHERLMTAQMGDREFRTEYERTRKGSAAGDSARRGQRDGGVL